MNQFITLKRGVVVNLDAIAYIAAPPRNTHQRTLPKNTFDVACCTLRASPKSLLLVDVPARRVRALAAALEFGRRNDTPAARAAMMRLRIAAEHCGERALT